MNTYARIQNGAVAELLASAVDPATLFNPALVWELIATPGVAVGWLYANGNFAAPPPVSVPSLPTPSLAQLQTELATLTAQIAALSASASTTTGG